MIDHQRVPQCRGLGDEVRMGQGKFAGRESRETPIHDDRTQATRRRGQTLGRPGMGARNRSQDIHAHGGYRRRLGQTRIEPDLAARCVGEQCEQLLGHLIAPRIDEEKRGGSRAIKQRLDNLSEQGLLP